MWIAKVPLKKRSFQSSPVFVVCIGLVMIATALSVVTWTLLDARRAARQQEIEAQSNLSVGLERDVRRTVEVMDLSIRSAVRGMEMPGIREMQPDTRQAVLFDGAIEAEGFLGAYITNEAGDFLYESAGAEHPQTNIGYRDYFQAQKNHPDLGLIVTPPLKGKAGKFDKLGLVRRYNHPDGSFAGVVIGVLRLDYLQSLAEPLALGKLGIVSLFNTDAVMIAHTPYVAQDIGQTFHQRGLLERLRDAPSGVFEAKSVLDGIERLYTYRQVGRLPLIVTIGRAEQDVYADWTQKTITLVGILALLVSIGVFLAVSLRRELIRRGQAERAARLSEQRHAEALTRLDALFQHSDEAMLVARPDQSGNFVYDAVNPVWERMTGVPRAMAIGFTPLACLPASIAVKVMMGWQECVNQRRPVTYGFDTDHTGQVRAWEVKVVPVTDANGAVTRLIAVARDVTQRKAVEDQLAAMNKDLAAQATTDSLTGLANRRRLDEALNDEWRRAARDGSPLSMMMIDLDRFKLFNDQYGHQLGDACLQATAKALGRFVRRPGDVAARYGGEELAILLPKTDAPQAALLAERVRAAIEATAIEHEGNRPFGVVTASIGVTTLRPFASGAAGIGDELIATADAALYEAKRNGRNRVSVSRVAADDVARKPHLTLVPGGL